MNVLENYKGLEREREDNVRRVVDAYLTQTESDEEESKHYTKFVE